MRFFHKTVGKPRKPIVSTLVTSTNVVSRNTSETSFLPVRKGRVVYPNIDVIVWDTYAKLFPIPQQLCSPDRIAEILVIKMVTVSIGFSSPQVCPLGPILTVTTLLTSHTHPPNKLFLPRPACTLPQKSDLPSVTPRPIKEYVEYLARSAESIWVSFGKENIFIPQKVRRVFPICAKPSFSLPSGNKFPCSLIGISARNTRKSDRNKPPRRKQISIPNILLASLALSEEIPHKSFYFPQRTTQNSNSHKTPARGATNLTHSNTNTTT